ncbi:MAG: alkaline phosphatase family protein [Myxococcota bacterium]
MKRRQRGIRPLGSGFARATLIAVCAGLGAGCTPDPLEEQAAQVCGAVEAKRFDEALARSASGAGPRGAGRAIAECRCLALLASGDREGCSALLDPLLSDPAAADWVPSAVLTKRMLKDWQAAGRIADAAALATRAAPVLREDLEILQLELLLRSRVEDERDVLETLEARLDDDPGWTAARLVLALAWQRRADPEATLRVLGATPPPSDHPLLMPWYESRIQAQTAQGDLAAVQASFAAWRATGWDPVDLEARYALRLSVGQLPDPERDLVGMLREAIAKQDRIHDRQVLWGLHRRLITELLARGEPERALEAWDAAARVVSLEDLPREEIEREIARRSTAAGAAPSSRLRFVLPPGLERGEVALSPGPSEPPDAGYARHAVGRGRPLELDLTSGSHARRWVLRDGAGVVRASGSVWPAPGRVQVVEPVLAPLPGLPGPPATAGRRPADGRRRVFAILGDCADWRVVEYLRARGELPFHDRLFAEGWRAVLTSRPAFTAAAMQSLVWPAPPGRRDALGWIHQLGLELAGLESVGRNPVEWLSWVLPERPNLFETLGRGPRTTANMLLAHGRIEAGRHAELVGPDGRRRQLASQDAYRPLRPEELARHPALHHDRDTRQHAETIAAEMDVAERLAGAGTVDFLFLRLESLDLLTHAHFAALDGAGQDDGRGPLASAYRYIDDRLAALDARLDEDDWLVYLSDHGIRSSMQHEEDALFAVLGRGVPAGRAEGAPDLRGVPRSLAAMFGLDPSWPETGTTPWLTRDDPSDRIASHP